MFLAPPSLRFTRGWSISQAKQFRRSFSRRNGSTSTLYPPLGPFSYQSSYFVLLIGSEVKIPIDLRAVSRVAELFDRLGKKTYFTKLDLRSGYSQVRIAAGDETKTTILLDIVPLTIAFAVYWSFLSLSLHFVIIPLLPMGPWTHLLLCYTQGIWE